MVQTWVLNFSSITLLVGKKHNGLHKGSQSQCIRSMCVKKQGSQGGAWGAGFGVPGSPGSSAAWVLRKLSCSLTRLGASTITPGVPGGEVCAIKILHPLLQLLQTAAGTSTPRPQVLCAAREASSTLDGVFTFNHSIANCYGLFQTQLSWSYNVYTETKKPC